MSALANVGDRGQRYEVRFRANEPMIGPYWVLGWAATRDGARKMAKAWGKAPDVVKCWIYDREGKA